MYYGCPLGLYYQGSPLHRVFFPSLLTLLFSKFNRLGFSLNFSKVVNGRSGNRAHKVAKGLIVSYMTIIA